MPGTLGAAVAALTLVNVPVESTKLFPESGPVAHPILEQKLKPYKKDQVDSCVSVIGAWEKTEVATLGLRKDYSYDAVVAELGFDQTLIVIQPGIIVINNHGAVTTADFSKPYTSSGFPEGAKSLLARANVVCLRGTVANTEQDLTEVQHFINRAQGAYMDAFTVISRAAPQPETHFPSPK